MNLLAAERIMASWRMGGTICVGKKAFRVRTGSWLLLSEQDREWNVWTKCIVLCPSTSTEVY